MHCGDMKLKLLFVDRKHILKSRTAPAITILNKNMILLLGSKIGNPRGITQMPIKGIHTMAKVIQFHHLISLFILNQNIGISPACNSFRINLNAVGTGFSGFDHIPIAIPFAVEPARNHRRQSKHLRLLQSVIGFSF